MLNRNMHSQHPTDIQNEANKNKKASKFQDTQHAPKQGKTEMQDCMILLNSQTD